MPARRGERTEGPTGPLVQLALTLDEETAAPPPAERILEGLNPEQRRAVEWDTGPLLIIAGAGTGKTSVITRRIAYLIATKRARPQEILALTFTDKAAAEMEERVDVLVPYGYTEVWISTFHAFGDRVLRENALLAGLPPDFLVLSRAEQVLFLREHLFELPLRAYRPLADPTRHLQALVQLFSRAKDEDASPEDYRRYAESLAASARDPEERAEADRQMELAEAYAAYQRLLAAHGMVDFGDLITRTLQLFREHPQVLRRYQDRFRYVLVDEFQDTNHAQFQLVKLLCARHRNVTAVGDDDQAIYKWRGAALSNLLHFTQTYPDAQRVVLVRNYRSSQAILDAAYRLVRHNDPDRLEVRERVDKRLVAEGPEGPEPQHLHFDTLTTEADAVAATIADRVAEGRWRYRDVAVLVRSNADAEPFLRALNLRGVPFQFTGSRGLYDREEIRVVLAFLRVLADPLDWQSLYLLGTSPLYAVRATDLSRCLGVAHARHRSLEHLVRQVLQQAPEVEDLRAELAPESLASLGKLVDDLDAMRQLAAEQPTGRVLYVYLVERTGYVKRLATSGNPSDEARVRNLARFFDIVARTAPLLRYDRAVEFVRHLDDLIAAGDDPPVEELDPEADAVQVMTVHKAKGLEFPVVFLVSCVNGKFPVQGRREELELPAALLRDALPEGDPHLQEERRLFYVAMTRAKRELYFTSARDYGGLRPRKVSRFVLEALDRPGVAAGAFRASGLEQIRRHAPAAEAPVLEGILPPEAVVTVSFRQLDDYQTCPLKYKYAHVLRVPVTRDHRVVYGAAIHEAVREYHRRRARRQPVRLEDVVAHFERVWVNEGFLSREHEEQRLAEGREVLRRFFEFQEASGTVPTLVEHPFSFVRGNTRVRGRWDRVDVRDGQVCVVDFKTSDVREAGKADRRAAQSLQLQLYALAYREVHGRLPDRMELHFLHRDGVVVGTVQPEPAWVAEAEEVVDRVAEGIRRQDFTATPDWYGACRFCAFAGICPYTARAD